MKAPRKAVLVPLHEKDSDRVMDDIRRTPEERIKLMFELMRLAIVFSPSEGPHVEINSRYQWWILKRVSRNV